MNADTCDIAIYVTGAENTSPISAQSTYGKFY